MEKKRSKKKMVIVFFLIFVAIVIGVLSVLISNGFELMDNKYLDVRKISENAQRKKDTEFKSDSKIRITKINKVQQHNLYVLAKV